MEEKEIELIDYLNVIWKRKWLIVIGTILFMTIAGFFILALKPVFEIDTIIQPEKLIIKNQSGAFEEVVIENFRQIAYKIKQESYNELIAAELQVDMERFPDLHAERVNALLTKIWIRDHDIELSKKILSSLILHVKKDIGDKIEVELSNIDKEIKLNEIVKERRKEEIEILGKKLKIITQRKNDIQAKLKSGKNKISELEEEQLKILKKENRSEMESLFLLFYSSEIQKSIHYYDNLKDKLKEAKIDEEDIYSALKEEHYLIIGEIILLPT